MDTTNKLSEAQERERFEVVANEQGLTPGDFKLGAYLGWLLAKKDAAQATQAVSEPVAMQPAEAVAEFNNGSWRLRIGSVYMTAPNPPVGPQMVSEEYKVRMYAARINAEIRGGVAAFGCDVEARGLTYSDGDKISRCGSWCGLNQCAVSLKSAVVIHPAPASASEPLQAMADNERELGLDYGLGSSTGDATQAAVGEDLAIYRRIAANYHKDAPMAHRCIKPQCPENCCGCNSAIPESDTARILIVDLLNTFAVDERGAPIEDEESSLVKRAREYITASASEPAKGDPAPPHSLPGWDECALRVHNSDFIAKRVAEGGYGAEHDSKLASQLHRFIYEYDDADPYRSAWFMHRLELLVNEIRSERASASVAGAGKAHPLDTQRLDWLESRWRIEFVRDHRLNKWAIHTDHDLYCRSATTIRDVVDAAAGLAARPVADGETLSAISLDYIRNHPEIVHGAWSHDVKERKRLRQELTNCEDRIHEQRAEINRLAALACQAPAPLPQAVPEDARDGEPGQLP